MTEEECQGNCGQGAGEIEAYHLGDDEERQGDGKESEMGEDEYYYTHYSIPIWSHYISDVFVKSSRAF